MRPSLEMQTEHMNLRLIILSLAMACCTMTSAQEQETTFPFPAMPDSLREPTARLKFLLEHYWSVFNFDDTSDANRATAEQGFVDYINLMQLADSAVQAASARIFVDSISQKEHRQLQFNKLINHYLDNPESPMRNDVTYVHLLRAMPKTPQRTFLIQALTKNTPGTVAADIPLGDAICSCDASTPGLSGESGKSPGAPERRLHQVQSPTTLLVLYDPFCGHCLEMMPKINEMMKEGYASQTCAIYINVEQNTKANEAYYISSLPALYLLDSEKKVLVKEGSLEQIEKTLKALNEGGK